MGVLGKPRPQVDFPVIVDSKCLITTIQSIIFLSLLLRYYLPKKCKLQFRYLLKSKTFDAVLARIKNNTLSLWLHRSS